MALVLVAVVAAGSAATARAIRSDGWAWQRTLGAVSFGRAAGTSDLTVDAPTVSATIAAGGSMSLGDSGGNYEFEHSHASPVSIIGAASAGKPVPIRIGLADGQDLTPLEIWTPAARAQDLQEWMDGSKVVAAIDGFGRLRLGSVTLSVEGTKLFAVLPDGSQQVLVAAG